MKRFESMRVLVTGGANGLGLGVVERFVGKGGVLCDVCEFGWVDGVFEGMLAAVGVSMWRWRMPGLGGWD